MGQSLENGAGWSFHSFVGSRATEMGWLGIHRFLLYPDESSGSVILGLSSILSGLEGYGGRCTGGGFGFLDPPYTETIGYGTEWTVGDQLDVLLWVEEASRRGVLIVCTNHEAMGRHYARIGCEVSYLTAPARGRTSKARREMLAWSNLTPGDTLTTLTLCG